MPVQRNKEVFKKIEPKIEIGITIATFYITTEPLWQRILIKTSFISTILCIISSIFYIANVFQGHFTENIAMSLMLCSGCTQILFKSIIMRRNRSNLLELLKKVQSFYNKIENKELNSIAEKNLKKLSKIWEICFK